MPDEPTIGVDERTLDDLALEGLAIAHVTAPPAALRTRVLRQARRERAIEGTGRALARWRRTAAVAAVAVLALSGLLAREIQVDRERAAEIATLEPKYQALVQQLTRSNAELLAKLEEQGRTLAGLREAVAAQATVLRVLSGPRTLSAALEPKEGFTGSGRVVVDPASGEAAIVVAGLAPAGEGKTYELWAIRSDRPPEPAGLFTVGADGMVAARAEQVQRPGEVAAFAVSIEPAGGSKAPTGPIVLVGALTG